MKEGTKMDGRKAHYKQPKVRSGVRALVIATDRRRSIAAVFEPSQGVSPTNLPSARPRASTNASCACGLLGFTQDVLDLGETLENTSSMGFRSGENRAAGTKRWRSGLLDEFSYSFRLPCGPL